MGTAGLQTLLIAVIPLLLCAPLPIPSQTGRWEVITINPAVVPYRLRFVENAATKNCGPDPDADPCVAPWLRGWLRIYRGKSTRPLQTIAIRVSNTMVGAYAVRDVNFDGYQDIFFAVDRGGKFTQFQYWLFDPVSGRFGNPPLAIELESISVAGIEFDGVAKEIRSTHFFGACHPVSRHTYRIEMERLVLVAAFDNVPGSDRDCVMVDVRSAGPSLNPAAHDAFESWVNDQKSFPATSGWIAERITANGFQYTNTRGNSTIQRVRVLLKNRKWYVEAAAPAR